jgi:hypothetical protein
MYNKNIESKEGKAMTKEQLISKVEEEIKKTEVYNKMSIMIDDLTETEKERQAARNMMIAGIIANNKKIRDLYLQSL